MNEELQKLELEAARLKVEREILALQREIQIQQRSQSVSDFGKTAAEVAGKAAVGFFSIGIIISLILGGFLVGILAVLTGITMLAIRDKSPGDFFYHFGFILGGTPWWVWIAAIVIGVVWIFDWFAKK